MARIRSSKPEWWKSAKWCRLSRDVRATYKGIWEVMCDDEGRFLADSRQVKAEVWPLDDDITPKKLVGWLGKLGAVRITLPEKMGGGKAPAIQLYVVDGVEYGYLAGFVEHQKISHALPSKLPKPPSLDRNTSGEAPDVLPNGSGGALELLRPEEERDVDVDVDVDFDFDKSEEEVKTGAPVSPRVVLPPEAKAFLAQFYEPAFNDAARKRYRNIKAQLYEVLDPLGPGPKIRGGLRVKARGREHMVDVLKAVMRDPPPDRDLAIVWFLKKLLDPEKGQSMTEKRKASEAAERATEDQYHAEAKRVGIRWANEHPDDYKPIVTELEARYRGRTGGMVGMAKEAELTQRCAKAAGFPSFEDWRANLNGAHTMPPAATLATP